VRVIETISGMPVERITTQSATSGIAVHRDGKCLAVLAGNELALVNLETGETTVQDAGSIGSTITAEMEWVDDNYLAIAQGRQAFLLYSLTERLPVWNYQFNMDTFRADARSEGRTRTFCDGNLL
jgi:hypothetical protein